MANKRRKPKCESVGAIVKNSRGEYLVVYRKETPRGLAFVAGHREDNERPEDAIKRELLEEAGIKAKHVACLIRAPITGRCKRGAKKHLWHVYKVLEYSGRPKRREAKKHAFVKFMSPERIREYIKDGDIDPAWTEILRRLRICKNPSQK